MATAKKATTAKRTTAVAKPTVSSSSTLPEGVVEVREISGKEHLVILADGTTFKCHPDTDLSTVIDQMANPLPKND